jgi:hypothetical protein
MELWARSTAPKSGTRSGIDRSDCLVPQPLERCRILPANIATRCPNFRYLATIPALTPPERQSSGAMSTRLDD